MKKLFCLLCVLICLTGCSKFKSKDPLGDDSAYNTFYNAIKENTTYLKEPQEYSLSYEVTKSNDKYLYYIIIDNPKVAMINLRAMALEDATKGLKTDAYVYANVGLTDEMNVNLVPNQVDSEHGFQKGVVLSGETYESEPVLDILISYYNDARSVNYRHYYQVKLSPEGAEYTVTAKTSEEDSSEGIVEPDEIVDEDGEDGEDGKGE